ncbi:PTS sugar transporter subunit IIA [Luteolibacter soli]|uniref:PTS sugar transporter subunit IIA n=1 Tax=Luteolibacter soli TaxID=3135280 RepID=A0ABU9AT44_9BACT
MPSYLPPESPITLDLEAGGEEQAIRSVAGLLEGKAGIRDHAAFIGAVLERQKINPPLLGCGIALPHARTGAVSEIVFAAARCREPVDFSGTAVSLVFLFGVPPDRIAEYLAMTAALARRLRDPKIVADLMGAADEASFRSILEG